MFRRFTTTFILTLGCFAAAACASESGDGGGAGAVSVGGIAENDFCRVLAENMCSGVADCCSMPFSSENDCVYQMRNHCDFDIMWDVEDGEYDPARAATLIDSIREAATSCGYIPLPEPSDMLKLHHPKIGESCGVDYGWTDNYLCGDDAYCEYSEAAGGNVCTRRPVEGEACDDAPCVKGYTCKTDGPGTDTTCHRRLAQGEACTSMSYTTTDCQTGMQCLFTSATTGACEPLRDVGAACWSKHDCKSNLCPNADQGMSACAACAADTDCSSSFEYCYQGSCVPTIPQPDGEPCLDDDECLSGVCFQQSRCGYPTGDDQYCYDPREVDFTHRLGF